MKVMQASRHCADAFLNAITDSVPCRKPYQGCGQANQICEVASEGTILLRLYLMVSPCCLHHRSLLA
jgi:hypothetical protein